ncbi:MAG: Uma2 family endonuclease [Acetobacteraceae bacterium]
MTAAHRQPTMTMEGFLEWEAGRAERWEFDGFRPVAMVGASPRHNRIAGNAEFTLRTRLRAPYVVYRETVRLRLADAVRYPDLMVVCGAEPPAGQEITDPVVVFEVLSPATARTDRIAKNREYAAHPSILRYILLEQDAIAAEIYSREAGRWVRATATGADAMLDLPEIGVSFPLGEAYAGLEVTEPDSGP